VPLAPASKTGEYSCNLLLFLLFYLKNGLREAPFLRPIP
jgi:hypothetical protein